MLWQIEKGIRCDIVCYAAPNLNGKRSQIRIFPGGNRQGDVPAESFHSMVIRAPYGIRLVLISDPGPAWEASPWRCIRLLEDHSLRSEGSGMPGVRIPDIRLLDKHGAKKTDTFMESTYVRVERLADGVDWTFGRTGQLAVRLIRVERDREADDATLPAADAVARQIYQRVTARDPAGSEALAVDVTAALRQVLTDGSEADVDRRIRVFEEWLDQS